MSPEAFCEEANGLLSHRIGGTSFLTGFTMGTFKLTAFLSAGVLAIGCSLPESPGKPTAATPACVADAIGELDLSLEKMPDCPASKISCRDACLEGQVYFCLARAYAIQDDPSSEGEAILLFHRACLLGSAPGCTNYAASIWAHDHSAEQLSCAKRTFEKACAAKEAFACGMIGRLLMDSAKTAEDFAEVRRYLEARCEEVRGFPCRVLAKHLESGELGTYQPERIRDLLKRGCEGGDPDACGEPATAAETFR